MTNETRNAQLRDEFISTHAELIANLIKSRGIEKIIEQFEYDLDDAIADAIPFPDFEQTHSDIDENDNDDIAIDIRAQIELRIISEYFKSITNNHPEFPNKCNNPNCCK